LFPAIGLIQIGQHARADRYTYVPLIGILFLVVWAAAEIVDRKPRIRMMVISGMACVIVALLACTQMQMRYWHTSESLFRHALATTKNNALAHLNLATALAESGNLTEAEGHYAIALRIEPDSPDVLYNLGLIHAKRDETAKAIKAYQEALRIRPDYADALNNLAWIRAANSDADFRNAAEGIRFAQRACELTNYRNPTMIGTLAAAYAEAGQFEEAVKTGERAVAVAEQLGMTETAKINQELIERYQMRKRYVE
jgi:tetratricopeptide (TPR) repeat protein